MKRFLILLGLALLAGCGTGYYDELYNQHLKELQLAAKFIVLWPGPNEIPGTDLVVRLPKIFERAYNKNSTYSDDPNAEIDMERLNPPFLNPFPGLINCYETYVKDADNQNLPVYLYTGMKELSAEGKAAFEQEMLGKLKALNPDANLVDVQAPTPQGTSVPWKRIDITLPQDFFPQGQGKKGAKRLPGVFELWFYDTPTGLIIFGWRATDAIAAQINLPDLANMTAGTLTTKPPEVKPAEPAAADEAPAGGAPNGAAQ
ncbi:MAG TPA: hypothetical protein VMF30_03995 [Pirellulales bacterium]|nr:hypothetical protein [Pirellulales bacterium]